MPCTSPCRYCRQEIPPGLRQEFIAPTFLESFGWISLLNPFLLRRRLKPSLLSDTPRVVHSLALRSRKFPSNRLASKSRHDDHRSRYPEKPCGRTACGRVPRTLLDSRLSFFLGRLGKEIWRDRQQMKLIYRARKRPS